VTKARKEKKGQEVPVAPPNSEAEAVDKRKIENVEADKSGAEEMSNDTSSTKRVKLYDSSSCLRAWLPARPPVSGSSSSSKPEASSSMQKPTGGTGTVNNDDENKPHASGDPDKKDTVFKVPELTSAHRYLNGKRMSTFPIYEDSKAKQDRFLYAYESNIFGFRSPSEEKENTGESFSVSDSDDAMDIDTDSRDDYADDEMEYDGGVELDPEDTESLSLSFADASVGTADPADYLDSSLEPGWTSTRHPDPAGPAHDARILMPREE